MSDKTLFIIRVVYGCILALFLVLTGVLLILSALSIYQGGGESPYTPEAIASRFSTVAPFLWTTVALVAIGIPLRLGLPMKKKPLRELVDRRALLRLTEQKKDVECAEYRKVSAKEKKLRLTVRASAVAISVLGAIPAILHLSKPDSLRFPEYNDSIIAALPTLSILALCVCAATAVAIALCDRSYLRQIKALATVKAVERELPPCPCAGRVFVLRIVVAVIAVALLAVGIFGGGMADVLAKAINICTECIGLG